MKRLLVPLVLIIIAWDALWAFLGVKPLFPWQLREEMAKGGPGLVLLDGEDAQGVRVVSPAGGPAGAP